MAFLWKGNERGGVERRGTRDEGREGLKAHLKAWISAARIDSFKVSPFWLATERCFIRVLAPRYQA